MKTPDVIYCYWVEEGRLLAGEYPGHPSDDERVREKVGALLAAGVTLFVDLTHVRDGMRPYEPVLHDLSPQTARLSAPIVDNDVPQSPNEMSRILDAIDAEITRGGVAYIHCWGGVGRTGTTAGCWFARHGHEGDAALTALRALEHQSQTGSSRYVTNPRPARLHPRLERGRRHRWMTSDGCCLRFG